MGHWESDPTHRFFCFLALESSLNVFWFALYPLNPQLPSFFIFPYHLYPYVYTLLCLSHSFYISLSLSLSVFLTQLYTLTQINTVLIVNICREIHRWQMCFRKTSIEHLVEMNHIPKPMPLFRLPLKSFWISYDLLETEQEQLCILLRVI